MYKLLLRLFAAAVFLRNITEAFCVLPRSSRPVRVIQERVSEMNYKIIDMEKYYRREMFRRFSEDCRCSVSMTSRLDVTKVVEASKKSQTKFYVNFLYIMAQVLNSREDYRLCYLRDTQQLVVYDKINPAHYVFYEKTKTCTPVYTEYQPDYAAFYDGCTADIAAAKQSGGYLLDDANHPNWFDASYISWLSYDSLHVELPDGYLHFMPIINWGRYRREQERLVMPVSVRLNHAAADGYLISQVFLSLQQEMDQFAAKKHC